MSSRHLEHVLALAKRFGLQQVVVAQQQVGLVGAMRFIISLREDKQLLNIGDGPCDSAPLLAVIKANRNLGPEFFEALPRIRHTHHASLISVLRWRVSSCSVLHE